VRASLAALLAAVIGGVLVLGVSPAVGAQLPSGFHDEPVITGLTEPSTFRFSPDGRVFVAEKAGRILVYDGLDDPSPELFADLRTEAYDTGDRGILGLALDPEFPTRPYVYVLYTYDHILGDPAPAPRWGTPDTSGDPCPEPKGADACLVSGRLVRLTAQGDHAAEGLPGKPLEDVLVEGWCAQFSSHSIGDLRFGSEGALYASGGDGASFSATDIGQLGEPPNPCGDPPEEGGALRAQDVRTGADPTGLNGTVIRVDPDTGKAWPGNPLSGPDENARRIVAAGFRNPFRFAIDPTTHELYVGNVGWDTYEEIDRFNPASAELYNSGWPCYEGPAVQPAYENAEVGICEGLYADPDAASLPFFSYMHREDVAPGDPCLDFRGSAISGFAFYEDGPFPSAYHGAMFFADSVRGCIFSMLPGEDGRPDPSTVTAFMHHSDPYSGVDLEIGPDGDLYYLSLFTEDAGNEFEPGAIHRIHYSSSNQTPVAQLSVDRAWSIAGEPLEAVFDASGSSDDDGDPLEYEWDLNGDGVYTDAPTDDQVAEEYFDDEENHTVSVRVIDSHGAFSIARVTVFPGDTPPEPVISKPGPGFKWTVGSPVDFGGFAEDEEDGDLPATSLDWVTRLYHCPLACHAHPLQAFPAVASGSLLGPEHDLPSHLELTLTAVDSRGLATQTSVDIQPQIVNLEIASNPPGLILSAGPLSQAAPFTLSAIKGSQIALIAPESASLEGVDYIWTKWSDNGARTHTVVAGSVGKYTATFAGGGVPGSGNPSGLATLVPTPTGQSPAGAVPRASLQAHPAKRTHSSTARYEFASSPPGAGFECKLDKGAWRTCRSPKVYTHLKSGSHMFSVVAIAAGGQSEPAKFSWRVLPKKPQ
jgi:glucose/arabinose dehydrogenase